MTQPTTYYTQSQPIVEGTRYYNLSQRSLAEAQLLYQELSPYASLPFLMPDGRFLLPPCPSPHEKG